MATEAERRLEQVDSEKVAAIKQMLDQPGGQDEVAKRFGKSELTSEEFATARRQQAEARARRREAAEKREQDARQERSQVVRTAEKGAQRATDPAQVRDRLKEGQKNLRKAEQQSRARSQARADDKVQSQSQSM